MDYKEIFADVRLRNFGVMNTTLVVGDGGGYVSAFKVRNNGTNSKLILQKGGGRIELLPGQEESFGTDKDIPFRVNFTLMWDTIGPGEVNHKATLSEIVHRKN
jgi:hypothetical protein